MRVSVLSFGFLGSKTMKTPARRELKQDVKKKEVKKKEGKKKDALQVADRAAEKVAPQEAAPPEDQEAACQEAAPPDAGLLWRHLRKKGSLQRRARLACMSSGPKNSCQHYKLVLLQSSAR